MTSATFHPGMFALAVGWSLAAGGVAGSVTSQYVAPPTAQGSDGLTTFATIMLGVMAAGGAAFAGLAIPKYGGIAAALTGAAAFGVGLAANRVFVANEWWD